MIWERKKKKKNRLTKYTTNARFKNYRLETVAPFVANVCTPIDSIQITFCLLVTAGKQRGHTRHRRSAGVHRWKKELRRCSQVSCSRKNPPDKVLHERTIRFFCDSNAGHFATIIHPSNAYSFFSLPSFFFFPPEYRVPRTTLAKGLLEEEVEWDRNFRKGNDRWKYQFISFDEFSSILFTYIYDRYLIYFNISKIVFINRKNNIDICVLIVKSMFHVSNGLFFFLLVLKKFFNNFSNYDELWVGHWTIKISCR